MMALNLELIPKLRVCNLSFLKFENFGVTESLFQELADQILRNGEVHILDNFGFLYRFLQT